ncbi:hypothetical protein EVAR_51906_1 [Eumeta japonica]|uniref:Uncharacterized protein n=1 Tax=Eumeta variegata TaxID=151549 RepID=A0A4C1XHU1_EUMVA|nr:hypothetical protein EVAR_51906_1 [Eumeta japonica]
MRGAIPWTRLDKLSRRNGVNVSFKTRAARTHKPCTRLRPGLFAAPESGRKPGLAEAPRPFTNKASSGEPIPGLREG